MLLTLMTPSCECDDDFQLSDKGAVVIFVVKKKDSNFVDQRLLEFGLWENHRYAAAYSSLLCASTIYVGRHCHLNVRSILVIESQHCK